MQECFIPIQPSKNFRNSRLILDCPIETDLVWEGVVQLIVRHTNGLIFKFFQGP